MVFKHRLSLFNPGSYVGFDLLNKLSEGCTFLRRDFSDCLLGGRKRALLT
jgi:hypothetical protein